jgi:hypothetical protein
VDDMVEEKKDKEITEKKATKEDLSVNSTMTGALAYQSWEQAKDKTIDDYYIGKRREVILKLSIYMRKIKERLLIEKANGGKVTVQMEIDVAQYMNEMKILKDIGNTVKKFSNITNDLEDRNSKKISVIYTPKDIMTETYYHDMGSLEKMDALLTALIDEDVLPVAPKSTKKDIFKDKLIKELKAGLGD